MKTVWGCWTAVLFAMCLLCLPSGAQAQKGNLSGTVLTLWGTAVPSATVTLTNRQGGAKVTATTDQSGEYHFQELAPGQYDLSVSAANSLPYNRLGIQVGEGASRRESRLQPGKEDIAAAIKEFEAKTTEKPDDYVARFNLGRAYFVSGNNERAVEQFVGAFHLKPDYLPNLVGLAQLSLRVSNIERALQFAGEILKLKPDNSLGNLLEAVCYDQMGNFDDARKALDVVFKNDPDDLDALLELGNLNLSDKHYREAETPFRRAWTLDPSVLRGIEGVAEVHLLINEPDQAVQIVAAEAEKDPQNRDLRKLLGAVELRAQKYDPAIATYQSLIDPSKDAPLQQADLYAHIAEAYGKKDDFQHGADNYKKAIELAPKNVAYPTSLATLYERAGKKQEAMATYRDALQLKPGSPVLLNNLAFLMADNGGNLDEALSIALMAKRQLPDLNEIEDTIGWIYLKKNLVDSASRVFAELVEKYSTNWMFHYHYAVALERKGDRAGALKELNAALENKPSKAVEGTIKDLVKKLSSPG